MSFDILQRIGAVSREIDDLTRFSARRERFFDMLDFGALPAAYLREASAIDARLEDQINDCRLERHYLEERLVELG